MKNDEYATIHMSEAYRPYKQWGAKTKCSQLEKEYKKFIFIKQHENDEVNTKSVQEIQGYNINANLSSDIDINTIFKVTHALSREIKRYNLFVKLLQIALENADSDRGVLITSNDNNLFIEVECCSQADKKESIRHRIDFKRIENHKFLSKSIVRYVARALLPLILDNTKEDSRFNDDEYIKMRMLNQLYVYLS